MPVEDRVQPRRQAAGDLLLPPADNHNAALHELRDDANHGSGTEGDAGNDDPTSAHHSAERSDDHSAVCLRHAPRPGNGSVRVGQSAERGSGTRPECPLRGKQRSDHGSGRLERPIHQEDTKGFPTITRRDGLREVKTANYLGEKSPR